MNILGTAMCTENCMPECTIMSSLASGTVEVSGCTVVISDKNKAFLIEHNGAIDCLVECL
jgi:hypothetical protein